MLKRKHLIYRINSGNIKPGFVDPSDPEILENAAGLIAVYSGAVDNRMPRHELDRITSSMIRRTPKPEISAGLNKLLLDRCNFAHPHPVDYPALRKERFLQTARNIMAGEVRFKEKEDLPDEIDLYGDLPEFETITSFVPSSAEKLLHRYNLAQAQGLLFHASDFHLEIKNTPCQELRKLLKSIKFFRLFGKFRTSGKNKIEIDISGPLALFGPSAKYALQLANLLPAVVNLPDWKLSAEIRFKNRTLTLKLSDKNGLVSHYRNLAEYIPEEIKLFHRLFKEKSKDWEIVGDTPFLDGGEQEIIFPDLSFRSMASGQILHLELFHRWHGAGLKQRIALIARHPELPLLLGIDRSLVSSEEKFAGLFNEYPQVESRCWLFRDFPGVAATAAALKKFAAASQRSK